MTEFHIAIRVIEFLKEDTAFQIQQYEEKNLFHWGTLGSDQNQLYSFSDKSSDLHSSSVYTCNAVNFIPQFRRPTF